MISRFEKEILIAHALGLTRAQLLAKRPDELNPALYQPLLDLRAKGEPTAYITGYQPFMGLDFFVDRSVLIPRPETELLVEKAIKQLTANSLRLTTVLDLGAGSGCIAVTLAKSLPQTRVVGVDSSAAALAVARRNSERHGVSERCHFILSDMFENITAKTPRHQEKYDLIISNPPYIPTKVIETLEPEVKDWEPRQALDGGEDGLDYIKKIIAESPHFLKQNGILMLEFGFDQADRITKLAKKDYNNISIVKDLSGHSRIFIGKTGNRDSLSREHRGIQSQVSQT